MLRATPAPLLDSGDLCVLSSSCGTTHTVPSSSLERSLRERCQTRREESCGPPRMTGGCISPDNGTRCRRIRTTDVHANDGWKSEANRWCSCCVDISCVARTIALACALSNTSRLLALSSRCECTLSSWGEAPSPRKVGVVPLTRARALRGSRLRSTRLLVPWR